MRDWALFFIGSAVGGALTLGAGAMERRRNHTRPGRHRAENS